MFKILVDSGCDLTEDMKKKESMDVERVPLSLLLGNETYLDDENLDVYEYMDKMAAYPDTPKTAAPSPEQYLNRLKDSTNTFIVTLSSKLSGSYNSAMLAKEIYLEEIGDKFIHIFDSLSASVGQTLVAMKINECSNVCLSNNEIIESVNSFIEGMRTYFILDNYDNLVKNGRMNAYVAKLVSFLSIKAICAGIDGKIQIVDKARGYNKAITKLMDRMKDDVSLETRILGIAHSGCLDKAIALKEEITRCMKFKDIFIVETGGLCSTYSDRGGIILAY